MPDLSNWNFDLVVPELDNAAVKGPVVLTLTQIRTKFQHSRKKKEKTKKKFYIKIFSYCWGSILVASLFVSLVSLKPIIVVIHEERRNVIDVLETIFLCGLSRTVVEVGHLFLFLSEKEEFNFGRLLCQKNSFLVVKWNSDHSSFVCTELSVPQKIV